MQIRNDVPARHDRFTGALATPAWNDNAWFDSRKFSGVGWARDDVPYNRQFALVSPLHIVCANHYKPNLGTVMRFLNSDGVTVDRSVSTVTPIKNDLNQDSDLALATLSSPLLASDKVAPFPYLNLAGETAYLGTPLTVFGWQTKAAKGVISEFRDLVATIVNKTRVAGFDYVILTGDPDDCYLEIGDSGSPSFAMVGGYPALVGIHLNVEEDSIKRTSEDTFIPHYISQLNAAMAADGYHMIPAHAMQVSSTITPATWRQASPGNCRFDVKNVSSADVTNLIISLHFPSAAVPNSLTAPGWTITPGAPGVYSLSRAALPAATTDSITAAWADLGMSGSLDFELVLTADNNPQRTFNFTHALAPSYNAWAAGIADKSPTADPDDDGISNLLEYAFGGDPAVNSQTSASGAGMVPLLAVQSARAAMSFPLRDDAEHRGLSYVTEFSTSLASGSWSATPPAGYTSQDVAFAPAVAGYLLRTVAFDANSPSGFCRVRVELNE
jgi:hypothetical protein